ncbi:HNH endonuclease [Sulfitobacter sp. EhC04]|uniref:HNH endonuclease n=1 Tax=Sulfitobacter sp. EhC04 TaxID=1849168 RepID=UPI001372E723|nr:HNH endonuclease [Sulfitobacter sp. EhC04]
MASKALPCPTVLRQLLRYEPETGKLFWKPRPAWMFPDDRASKSWNSRFSKSEALTAKANGGLSGHIFGKVYLTHRVSWAIHYGEWPLSVVDHVNGNPEDNRISNLRLASHAENMRNRKKNANNASGLKGVHWCRTYLRWFASICVNKKRINLGSYPTKEAAHEAYCEAAERLHGEFARTK